MTNRKSFFLVAAEPSGDLHGADLAAALRAQFPGCLIQGVIGPAMRRQNIEEVAAVEELSVMGVTDVLKSLPSIFRVFSKVKHAIIKAKPSVLILIDAPSFNLRLAKSLRKQGYQGKIVQFISPTVWAWGAHRKAEMAKTLDMLLTIYPFEKAHFTDTLLKVEYIGHPLTRQIEEHPFNPMWKKQANIPDHVELIALFPGSRKAEVQRNLPSMLQAVQPFLSSERYAAISVAHANVSDLIPKGMRHCVTVPHSIAHYELMQSSVAALAKSGTVTLELALQECPTVVTYKLTTLNKFYAQYILGLNLPFYCIVNILEDKEVFKEWIATPATVEDLSQSLAPLLSKTRERDWCIEQCRKVKAQLGEHNAAVKAAELMGTLI